jgi:hypothetical protein
MNKYLYMALVADLRIATLDGYGYGYGSGSGYGYGGGR